MKVVKKIDIIIMIIKTVNHLLAKVVSGSNYDLCVCARVRACVRACMHARPTCEAHLLAAGVAAVPFGRGLLLAVLSCGGGAF